MRKEMPKLWHIQINKLSHYSCILIILSAKSSVLTWFIGSEQNVLGSIKEIFHASYKMQVNLSEAFIERFINKASNLSNT